MKKIFLLIAAITLAFSPLQAQQSKATRTKEIRAAYSAALTASGQTEEPRALGVTHIRVQHCFPGTGLQYRDVDIFENGDFNEDGSRYAAAPYFVRAKTNLYDCGGRKIVEEFLYDKNGKPMFLFRTEENVFAEAEIALESRYYFYEDGSLCDFIFKVKDRKTGQYCTSREFPDLFDAMNGEDWKSWLEIFDDYARVTSSLIDFNL